jgi:hypothetical protein
MNQWQRSAVGATALCISACGGGGGDGGEALPGKQTTFAIGGTVSGLTGSGLVLGNGSDRKSITANGDFRFDTELPSGTRYNINVATQPFGQRCSISNHDSTVANAAVTNITVACSDSLLTLGGAITGLDGSGLELQNNGGDNRVIQPNDTTFTFARTYTSGTLYNVTILRHPTAPAQFCEATNNIGSFGNADIDNVTIACVGAMTATPISPTAASVGISRDVAPTAMFSVSLDTNTVTGATVVLRSASGTHPISPTANNTQLALSPARQLLPTTNYTVEIGAGIRGAGGERLVSPLTYSFTTRDGQWQGRALAEEIDIGGISFPQVGLGANGVGFAVWTQNSTNPFPNAYANRYQPGIGWGIATPLDIRSANAPQVVVDASGNALAVWQQNDGSRVNILSSRYANSAWSTPVSVDATDNNANTPRLAMDGNGNAIVIWLQADNPVSNLYANRYSNGSWGTPVPLEPSINPTPRDITVAASENGDAMVVWSQAETHGGTESIYASRFSPASGWSAAIPIESHGGSAYFPGVAMDSSGNAFVVWQQWGNGSFEVAANRFTIASQWSTAGSISVSGVGAAGPRISVDALGNAIAIWTQLSGNRLAATVSRFSTHTGWGLPISISDPAVGNAYDVQLAVDNSGNALAVWDQEISVNPQSRHVHANRYRVGIGWGIPEPLDTDSPSSTAPRIALDASGSALAVWQQSDGTRNNVYSNRFQ